MRTKLSASTKRIEQAHIEHKMWTMSRDRGGFGYGDTVKVLELMPFKVDYPKHPVGTQRRKEWDGPVSYFKKVLSIL
jgi:hypothetical protein